MKRPIPADDSDDEAPEEVPRRRPRGDDEALRRRAGPPPSDDDEDAEPEAEEEDEEEEDEGDGAFAALRDVPFGELQRLQGDGRGLVGRGAGAAALAAARRARAARANKNRPAEQSSKRPVQYVLPQLEGAAGVAPQRKAGRDPRFESLSGDLDDAAFRKRYAFVFEEQLPEERKRLKALLQARNAAHNAVRPHSVPSDAKPVNRAAREEARSARGAEGEAGPRAADAEARRRRARAGQEGARRRHAPSRPSRAHVPSPAQERERRQREKEAVKGGKKPFYVKKCACACSSCRFCSRATVLLAAVLTGGARLPCASQLWRSRRIC